MRISRIFCSMAIAAVVLTLSHAASAQVDASVEDPWGEAKELYRQGAYAEAIPYLIEAAQRDPDELRYVVSLARAYYQAGNYDRAVYYYDLYIGSNQVTETSGRYSLSTARSERQSANRNREQKDRPPRPPSYETELLNSLESQIEAGPALTEAGGGAVATFRSLLRSGYVSPALSDIRQRLADKLLREARQKLRSTSGWIPDFSLDEWRAQAERYRLARSLLPPPLPFDRAAEEGESASSPPATAPDTTLSSNDALDAWVAFCEGQIQYLNENYDSALERFSTASLALPQHPEPLIGALNARVAGAQERAGAASANEQLEKLAALDLGRDKDAVIRLYRAYIAARSGRSREGAEYLRDFFLGADAQTDNESAL